MATAVKTEQRKQEILKRLSTNNRVLVSELSAEFDISEVTIRKYLQDLEARGLLKRTHGGAVYMPNSAEPRLLDLEKTNVDEKRAIARAAYDLISSDEAVFMDASTTVRQMIPFMKENTEKKLTVVTSSVLTAADLSSCGHIDVLMLGGYIRSSICTVMGPIAVDMIQQFHADKAFIGTNGVSLKAGFSVHNLFESQLKRAMIASSSQAVVLADSSKVDCVVLSRICPISDADVLVTDCRFPTEMADEIRKLGTEVVLADL